jgi:HEAT repeat protein
MPYQEFAEPLPLEAGLAFTVPEIPWDLQDSAYYEYRRAVAAMDEGQYRDAERYFGMIHRLYPRSVYAPESFYWQAFSLYRLGGTRNLGRAVELLDTQYRLHPGTRTASDGLTLATRLRGELAKAGIETARRELGMALQNADECSSTGVNVKIAALSAFQQIDPTMAMHHLREVFRAGRDCSGYLREQSVFILAQIRSPEAQDLMLHLAQYSREMDVRVEAVTWLSEVPDTRAVALLESILRSPTAMRLKEGALFALSRQASLADAGLFREIASSQYMPVQLRVQAVTWLAEQRLTDQWDWVLRLYQIERNTQVKHAIVNAIAAQRNVLDRHWLLNVARDSAATLDVRKVAVSAAGAMQTPPSDLFKLYGDISSVALREQIIGILAKHRDRSAVDVLIDIVSSEESGQLRGISLNYLRQSKDPAAVAFVSSHRER